MHFAENSKELEDIRKLQNSNVPIDLLEEYFKNIHIVLAHCVKVKPEEMNKLKGLDISVSHCPISNLKLGCGISKINEFIKINRRHPNIESLDPLEKRMAEAIIFLKELNQLTLN